MVENYTKDIKESVYHGAVVSALAIGYTMLGKTLVKMSPPSLAKFDVEDGVKSNFTILNEWHVISVTWSKRENLSNCWSNGVKLTTFTTGNVKGSDHCCIGNYLIIPHSQFSSIISRWFKTHLTGCIGEIIGFYRSLTEIETSYIHKRLMKKWEIAD